MEALTQTIFFQQEVIDDLHAKIEVYKKLIGLLILTTASIVAITIYLAKRKNES